MLTKFETPVPGEQPNAGAGALATMKMPFGPRINVIYAKLTVTLAALGAGVTSLPVLSDVANPNLPIFVKIGGKPVLQRLASELINENLLQDANAGGMVSYYQAGVLIARVTNAGNTSYAGLGLATNVATTAIFHVPIYFAEFWRKDVPTGEQMSLPTKFTGGLVSEVVTVEVPLSAAAANYTGHNCQFTYAYDSLEWQPTADGQPKKPILKRGRFTKGYNAVGDVSFEVPLKDALAQFSILLATNDRWSRLKVKKNGTTIKDFTPDDLATYLHDHGMNVAAFLPNMIHVIFDLNDDLQAVLPLNAQDTFEITVTLSTVGAPANAVVITQYYGLPD